MTGERNVMFARNFPCAAVILMRRIYGSRSAIDLFLVRFSMLLFFCVFILHNRAVLACQGSAVWRVTNRLVYRFLFVGSFIDFFGPVLISPNLGIGVLNTSTHS
jgi:hypothetical protein